MTPPLYPFDASTTGRQGSARHRVTDIHPKAPLRRVRSAAGSARGRMLRARQEGQAIVLVAFAFILLVAALGLGIDAANAFGQRRLANNFADAAAMAATRELVNQRGEASPSGTEINDIIDAYFAGETGIAVPVSWQAFYVDREDRDGTMDSVTSAAPPSGADGIRVQVNFAMPTIFMAVFGQESLTIGARGTAVFGPLGAAVGQDLVPLAITDTALQQLKDAGEDDEPVYIDLGGDFSNDGPPFELDTNGYLVEADMPEYIKTADFKHVSLADISDPMGTGNFSDCSSSSPENSLVYWWCKGTPNLLQVGRHLPEATTSWNPLRSAISWRRSNRSLIVLPVYTTRLRFVGGSPITEFRLKNFVAVTIIHFGDETYPDYDGTPKTYDDILRVQWVQDYATSGAMVGNGGATEITELWAVNLVR